MDTMNGAVEQLRERAERQLGYGDASGALDSLREALSIDPSCAYLHSFLALVLIDLGRVAAAKYEATVGLELEPESPFAHYALGSVLTAKLQPQLAIGHLTQCLELDPEFSSAFQTLARASELLGRRRDAKGFLERALEIDPEDSDVIAALAAWYLDGGDGHKARSLLQDSLQRSPQHQYSLVVMGQLLLREGRINEAYDHAIWALQQNSTDADALYLLSSVKARRNPLFGVWFRINSWLVAGGNTRTVSILVAAFVVFQVVSQVFKDAGYMEWSEATDYAWLAIVVYSWVGPVWFKKKVDDELKTVALKPEY